MWKELRSRLKKIRLIDYVFLSVLAVGAIFAVLYFKREKAYVYVDLTYERQNWDRNPFPPEYWEVADVKLGDSVYNSLGTKIATVTDIEKNIWGGGIRTYVEIQLRVEAVYDTRTKKYVLDGNPLLIGNVFSVDLGSSKFDGKIRNVYLNLEDRYAGYEKAKAVIQARYREIEAWHAESLRNFVQTNSRGEVIARVTDIQIVPAEVPGMNQAGQMVKAEHPFKKDAILTIEAPRILCRDGACYMNSYNTFVVGSGFWADSGTAVIADAKVMSVEITPAEW